MKKISSVFMSAVCLAVFFPTLSHAVLVTEHWVAGITNIFGVNTQSPTLAIGDKFELTFSYDDQSAGRTVTRIADGSTFVQLGSEDRAKDITSFTFSPNLLAAIADSTFITEPYYQTFIRFSPTFSGYNPTTGYKTFISQGFGYHLSMADDPAWNTHLRYNYLGGGEQQVNLRIESSSIVNSVPEPTTMLLFGTGIAGLAAVSRRRRK